jgi:hypothetical protein
MLTRKNLDVLKDDVQALGDRLGTLERQETVGQIKQLQDAQRDLTLKVSELTGATRVINLAFTVMAIVFAVLGALSGYSFLQYRQFEAVREGADDILVSSFEHKLADTIDRVSFIDPSDEQEYKLLELTGMQEQLRKADISSPRFQSRSDLTDAVRLIIDYKKDEAMAKLGDIKSRTTNVDPFVEARVLTLEAMVLVRPERSCQNPDVETKVGKALDKDSGVGAAYNILGICLTEKANQIIRAKPGPDRAEAAKTLRDGLNVLRDGLSYYELAYALKPTNLNKARLLNNKVSAYLTFLEAGLKRGVFEEILPATEYRDFPTFVNDSLRDVALSQRLMPKQAAYWETEAELYGLVNVYHESKNDSGAAGDALAKAKQTFKEALDRGLLRKMANFDEAMNYLRADTLLEKVWSDRDIQESIKKAVAAR